jgi:hypothetical protein
LIDATAVEGRDHCPLERIIWQEDTTIEPINDHKTTIHNPTPPLSADKSNDVTTANTNEGKSKCSDVVKPAQIGKGNPYKVGVNSSMAKRKRKRSALKSRQ